MKTSKNSKKNSNITSKPASINLTCVNNNLQLTNDSLKLHMNKSYEKGYSQSDKFNFGKLYLSFFSLSTTFLLTYLTCEKYKSLGSMSSDMVSLLIFSLFLLFLFLGVLSVIYSKTVEKNMLDQRDKAVELIMKDIKFSNADEKKT